MAIAQSVASLKEVLHNERISQGWFHQFLERHENLALRRRDSTAQQLDECHDPRNCQAVP